MATRPCAECGVPVTRHLSPKRLAQAWYCSNRHAALARIRGLKTEGRFQNPGGRKPRTGDTVACLVCGTDFYRQPAYIKQNRKLCSVPCVRKWEVRHQIVKSCAYCGTEFRVAQSEAHIRTCSRQCQFNVNIKRPTGQIHNGRPVRLNTAGYVEVWEPIHPNAKAGWLLEHRLVAEQLIGRPLTTEEQVDHINRDKADNRLANLQILSASDHSKKTNGENLSALKVLRTRMTELEVELTELRAKEHDLEGVVKETNSR